MKMASQNRQIHRDKNTDHLLPEARDEPGIGDQLQGIEGQSEVMIFKTRLCGDYTVPLKQINLTVQKLYLKF